jgi:hypothetical protein
MIENDMAIGAHNLLVGCGGLKRGDTLLVLYESADLNYYDQAIVDGVRQGAENLGIITSFQEVPFNREVADPSAELMSKMRAADRTLFLARMGDQIRFRPSMDGIRPIVSYALDGDMLASAFGQADYQGFVRLKEIVDSSLEKAKDIRVTCPLGTDFGGPCADYSDEAGDVTVARFPMSVFTPAPAGNFAGKIAQRGFLVGTGSQYYDPYGRELNETLLVHFDGHRITGFEGSQKDVVAAEAHYAHVAEIFDIDKAFVHSWHAGIHPGCDYKQPASASFERWSGGAFGNPRLMHFHTCGAYAPGEISLNVLDPTIMIDGVKVWDTGRFYPERIAGGAELFDEFPHIRDVFQNPAQNCGQGSDGQLSFT